MYSIIAMIIYTVYIIILCMVKLISNLTCNFIAINSGTHMHKQMYMIRIHSCT